MKPISCARSAIQGLKQQEKRFKTRAPQARAKNFEPLKVWGRAKNGGGGFYHHFAEPNRKHWLVTSVSTCSSSHDRDVEPSSDTEPPPKNGALKPLYELSEFLVLVGIEICESSKNEKSNSASLAPRWQSRKRSR